MTGPLHDDLAAVSLDKLYQLHAEYVRDLNCFRIYHDDPPVGVTAGELAALIDLYEQAKTEIEAELAAGGIAEIPPVQVGSLLPLNVHAAHVGPWVRFVSARMRLPLANRWDDWRDDYKANWAPDRAANTGGAA